MVNRKYRHGSHYPATADGEHVVVFYANGIFTTATGAAIHPDELEWIGPEFPKSAWQYPAADVQEEQIKKMVIDAMEYHWNDWVGDTGTLPDDFQLTDPRTKASFTPKQWAERVASDIAEQLKRQQE